MYLKRMELVGFKSFADKTELELRPGVTAVVGPNGSGKSNISDAIRWVLGEQSARSLRGAKMEDIIFAGSDARRPVNYGEVVLVLDNTDRHLDVDYSEVTVARRVYRSGESEYYLNKQSCRLKDIVELLMDSGLGKEAYSIIGQGRIEEILSTKAEDRRGIFEEAAGIVKYKARRQESVKRLDETEANLLRVSDIVSELRATVEPLEVQAGKAEMYQQYRDELEQLEVGLYVHDILQLHGAVQETTEALEEAELAWAGTSAQVAEREAQWQERHVEDEKLVRMVEEAQAKLVVDVEAVEKAEGRCQVLRERVMHLERLRDDAASVDVRAAQVEAEIADAVAVETRRQEDLGREIEDAQTVLEEQRAMAADTSDRAEQEVSLEVRKGELIDSLNQAASLRNDLKHSEASMETLRRRVERVETEASKRSDRIRVVDDQLADVERAIADDEIYLAESERKRQEIQVALKSSETSDRQDRQRLEVIRTELASLRSRLDLLKDMQQEYGGYQQGVRAVLQASGQVLSGIHGAVAELIRVPSEFEAAIETALGGSLQHIVVESERAGRDAIQYLKQRQAGRATMLPLDVIKGRALSSHQRAQAGQRDGYIGVASELVQVDDRFRVIVEHLLGHVVVAKDLAAANQIARSVAYQVRIVTLEGDVVSPGGSMTGGSVGRKGTSLLGRTREIEQLTEDVAGREGEVKERTKRLQGAEHARTQWEESIAKLDRERGERSASLTTLTMKRQTLQNQVQSLKEQIEGLGEERESLSEEITSLDDRREQLTALLTDSQQMIGQIEEDIRRREQALREGAAAERGAVEEMTEVRLRLAALHEQMSASVEQVRQLTERLERHRAEVETRRTEVGSQLSRLADTESELVAAGKTLAALSEARKKSEDALNQLRLERHALSAAISEAGGVLRTARDVQKDAMDAHHQLEVKVNRLDVELKGMLTKLSDDYHLGLELAREEYPIPQDVPAARTTVHQLRKAISDLGDVNLGAIEELARGRERLTFLESQMADLIAAKDKLYGVIADIDRETERRFLECFTAIRTEFMDVFAKLFGGGHADLVLSEPDQLLTTGIDIFAQPPGKKLQTLSLLSGGERALTAMALLFAILRVRPVPFCVLDEVEAALDDANVDRFAAYMREFSKSTQFLVITHRKGTMEGADVLYGVTMQESGVSRLMSIELVAAERSA